MVSTLLLSLHVAASDQNVEAGDFGGWDVVSQRVKEGAKVTSSCIDIMKQVLVNLRNFVCSIL